MDPYYDDSKLQESAQRLKNDDFTVSAVKQMNAISEHSSEHDSIDDDRISDGNDQKPAYISERFMLEETERVMIPPKTMADVVVEEKSEQKKATQQLTSFL